MILSKFEALHGTVHVLHGHVGSLLHFCISLHISLIMINHWLKWLALWLARHINNRNPICNNNKRIFRCEIENSLHFYLSSILQFLHTNTKNSSRFLIIILHWSRINLCFGQLSWNSSNSSASSWRWISEIELDPSVLSWFILHKASSQGYWSRSGAVESLNTRE